ncbi:MAG: MlaD family protein [Magnetovibrio sp.]|nr:MlaD family protein [Magnetovibrio sp.]
MTRDLREILIGAATVVGLVGILVFMNARHELFGADAGADLVVSGKFNKVDGLIEGSEVRLGGIRIGTVTGMALDGQYRAVVKFTIDAGYRLPKDTSAAIHTDGLFGSKFVVLEPGAEEAPLKSGDEITLTQDAVVVSDLLDLIISEGRVAQAKARQAAGK